MSTSQGSTGTVHGSQPGGGQRALTAAGYVLLFVLGALQGLIGSFQYGQGPGPLVAIVLVVIVFATCAASGWGFGTFGAGLLPAVGWAGVSFILAMSKANGSVVITATAPGEWYLYGGTLACLAGVSTAVFARAWRPGGASGLGAQAKRPG